jgi:Rhodopirellula transposase DDE domain
VIAALLALVEPDERGDPQSPLRWTTKSLRHLAEELTGQGHRASAPTVGRLLKREGFSLRANVKTLEGAQHPDRDAQFRYLNGQVKEHQASASRWSAWTPEARAAGAAALAGREWRPKGEPVEVEDHHFFFTGPEVEQAIPYGIYDLTRNTGWVNVGVDHDTCVFAVASIRRWWQARGRRDRAADHALPLPAGHLQVEQDRAPAVRPHHLQLAGPAVDQPRGGRQDHRGDPPRSGLRVEAALDPGDYPTGVAISNQQLDALPIQPRAVHGAWNYTLHPQPASGAGQAAGVACRAVPPSAARPCSGGWPIRG